MFGTDDETLEDAAVRHLLANHLTVATAESVTGGLVAHRLSRVAGASAVLHGGVVAYTDEMKRHQLGVPAELIECHTAVSGEVAAAMAEGVRKRFGTDLGVSTTGYAGPGPGPDGTPAGTVFTAVATAGGTTVKRFNWPGTRTEVQSRTASMVIDLVRHSPGANP